MEEEDWRVNYMKPIFETIYTSGMDWLRDAGYAVIVLLAAVTFPVWAVPYWIGTKRKGE